MDDYDRVHADAAVTVAAEWRTMMPVTVSLLHGTFARGSRWPVIEAEIRRQFAGRDPTVAYPEWSGSNTVGARLNGAAIVEAHVLKLAAQQPSAAHFIVAHSHGGNVAILALRNPMVRDAVEGVVCLSTPFLTCRLRAFPARDREFHEASAFMGALVFLTLVTWQALVRLDNLLLTLAVLALLVGGAIPLAVRWRNRAREFVQRVTSATRGTPILVIRSPGDEASLALTSFQALNTVVAWVWSFLCVGSLQALVGLLRRLIRYTDRVLGRASSPLIWTLGLWLWTGLGYFAFAVIVRNTNALYGSWPERLLVTPGVVMFIAGNAPHVIGLMLFVPLILLTAACSLPFGPAYALYAPFIEFSVEPSPDAASESVTLPWTDDSDSDAVSAGGVQHSRTHDDPRAAAVAVGWMRRIVDGQASPPAPAGVSGTPRTTDQL